MTVVFHIVSAVYPLPIINLVEKLISLNNNCNLIGGVADVRCHNNPQSTHQNTSKPSLTDTQKTIFRNNCIWLISQTSRCTCREIGIKYWSNWLQTNCMHKRELTELKVLARNWATATWHWMPFDRATARLYCWCHQEGSSSLCK